MCIEEDNFNIFWTSYGTLTELSGLAWHDKKSKASSSL